MWPIPRCCSIHGHQFIPSMLYPILLLFVLLPTFQSALILPMNSVSNLNNEMGFSLPESIRRGLDQIERASNKFSGQKRTPHSIPISSEDDNNINDDEEEDQSNEIPNVGGIPILSIFGKTAQSQQNQCFCCKAFVCRRQICPCSKFFL